LRTWFVHVEYKANVLRSIRFLEPKASRHSRLNDDDPFRTGQGHNDPLAPTNHLAHRRTAAVSRQVRRAAIVQQDRVQNLETLEFPPQKRWAYSADHRLDLRQLGHRDRSPKYPLAKSYQSATRHTRIRLKSSKFNQIQSEALKHLDKLRLIMKNNAGY